MIKLFNRSETISLVKLIIFSIEFLNLFILLINLEICYQYLYIKTFSFLLFNSNR